MENRKHDRAAVEHDLLAAEAGAQATVKQTEADYERQTLARQTATNNTAGPDWWDPGTRLLTVSSGDAGGVMRWLDEHGIGFETGYGRVPIVPFGMGSSLEGHVNAIRGGITVDPTPPPPPFSVAIAWACARRSPAASTVPSRAASISSSGRCSLSAPCMRPSRRSTQVCRFWLPLSLRPNRKSASPVPNSSDGSTS